MDDRIPLRLGALRLARRRGRTSDGAWAASRLRLEGVRLAPAEARFSRAVRVKFGRALRAARIRRGQPAGERIPLPLLAVDPPSRRRALIAAAISVAILLGALFLLFRGSYEEGGEPEGAPAAQAAIIATPSPVRGRTEPGVAALAVVVPSAAPTEGPPASSPPAEGGTGSAGTGTGAGGSGGGTGTGNAPRTPTPAPTPRPTTTPVPTAPPTVVPPSLVHVRGRVANAYSPFDPLPNVCISVGNLDCSLSPHTDANGDFDVVLDSRSTSAYSFRFILPGYVTNTLTIRLPLPASQCNSDGSSCFIGTINLRPQ